MCVFVWVSHMYTHSYTIVLNPTNGDAVVSSLTATDCFVKLHAKQGAQPRTTSHTFTGWLTGWQAGKGHGTTETFPGASSRLLPACHSATLRVCLASPPPQPLPIGQRPRVTMDRMGTDYKMNFICSRGGPSLSPMKISDGQSKACSSNRLICNGPQFLLFLYIFCVSSHTLSIDCFIWKH